MDEKICCICGNKIDGFGNNPWPIIDDEDSECCDACNTSVVIPQRLRYMMERDKERKLNGES